jgi:transcriptional regulator with XRE-family HTH domain
MTGARPRGLGAELKRLRKAANLSQPKLAERCGWSHSTISRIETGAKTPSEVEVATVLGVLGVVGDERDQVMHLARNAGQPNWYEVGYPGLPQQLTALLEFERDAQSITDIELVLVPGLLQTAEYTRAVIAAGGVDGNELESRVSVRLGRQSVLTRAQPVQLTALIDESALRRPIGGPKVMAEQLRHLLRMADQPNITIRVLPLDAGEHVGLSGSHWIFEFVRARTIVYLEHRRAGLFLDEPEDVAPYVEAVPTLHRVAMSTEESAELIAQCAQEMEARWHPTRPG